MNTKEQLMKDLDSSKVFIDTWEYEGIVNFILEDRKRIVEPLIQWKNHYTHNLELAINETLKNAGVEI